LANASFSQGFHFIGVGAGTEGAKALYYLLAVALTPDKTQREDEDLENEVLTQLVIS